MPAERYVNRPLTDKQIEYCRLRLTMEPKAAYEAAGYSMKAAVDFQVKTLEGNRNIQDKIDELAGRPPREWPAEVKPIKEVRRQIKQARKIVKSAVEFAPVVAAEPGAKIRVKKKVNEEEIEQKLWEIHESALAAGDRATARQCLVDLGKNKGMFTPTQKIRVERVEDLSDEQLEAMLKRVAESAAVLPQPEQEDAASGQLVN